jgi:K+-transporting ATPase ATPase A chain
MPAIEIYQSAAYIIILLTLVKPLGWYMYSVYEGRGVLSSVLGPVEYLIYRIGGIHPEQEMTWKEYLTALLMFNLIGFLATYAIQRLQFHFPLNPQHFTAVDPDLSFNTAISFITNTNWQTYSGERTLSYFTQMLGLTVQNFFSAATGMSLLLALVRGFTRQESVYLGNFWVDTLRGILYILLPLSLILATFLVSQGVVQNFKPYEEVTLTQPFSYENNIVTTQHIPMGPAASQVAIKQLGTNGGGYFNTNSAHPFENPTPLSNFLEMLALLLIPASLCYTFGLMVKDTKQGWAILLVLFLIYLPVTYITIIAEHKGTPSLAHINVDQDSHSLAPGGNMEGKETRFGIFNSAFWSTTTTASSNGSVNSMLSSFTPAGILGPLWLMQLGEVIFGGVGTGLTGMLILIIVTVFVAGLMVGRTPEYLGKKIEPFEMKMASFSILIMPCIVLVATALAVATRWGTETLGRATSHGFLEILYTFTSLGNNNGSALSSFHTNVIFYNVIGGIVMLIGRYWSMIAILALAGSLARKKLSPQSVGTLPTHTPLFMVFLISIIFLIGALTFLPALALGPIIEHLELWRHHGSP